MKLKILSLCMALAMALTCAFGLTACNENGVESVKLNADGELIVIMTDGTVNNLGKIKGEDGKDGSDGADGDDGSDGKDGVGVSNAYIDDDGNLIIELTNGEKLNCGSVAGKTSSSPDDLYYAEVKEEDIVTGYSVTGLGNASVTDLVIPSSYKNKPVVNISEEAFADCAKLVSVTIPDSVKAIGERAFADCAKLKNISVGSGLSEVGSNAFARCERLSVVNTNDIGAWCGISFAVPASNPLYFSHNLYLNNELLTELEIPATVTGIGGFAFYGCENLVSAETGSGVKTIGEQAFYSCGALKSLTLGGVETIGEHAFTACAELSSLSLGDKLKTVGDFAFCDCVSLTEVHLPSTVEAIGESAFTNCLQLAKLTLNDGLKTISDGAFAGCSALESFIMPDSVTSIGFGILMNSPGAGFITGDDTQSNISEIRISNSLTEIPDFAFSSCKIESIIIGNNITKINYSAFFGCEGLKSIVIPKAVKHISSYAFHRCNALQAVYYMGDAAEWQRVFIGSNGNPIKTAPVYFYSLEKPAESGMYWHYVSGVPTPWED